MMNIRVSVSSLAMLMWITIVICRAPSTQKYVNVLEFNQLSRGELLKILANVEENVEQHVASTNKKLVFTASFANNKFTKPHIYPAFFQN